LYNHSRKSGDDMKILISNYSSLPIYEQIREQIKEAILKGEIEPGSMLPSIRVLASQCKVGVITVKRAYEELEKEGLIFNRQGKGCFVKEINQEEVIKLYEQQLKEQIKELCRFCKEHAISETRMLALIEECKEEE
jgi:GntR family transcriptional regulator